MEKIKKFIIRLVKVLAMGIMDVLPNITASIQRNEQNKLDINWTRLITALVTFALFVSFLVGWITLEDLTQLLSLFE